MFWIIPILFALSAGLLGYIVLRALLEAEENYANEYTSDTARQFEDLFLFIAPQKILSLSRIVAVIVFLLLFFLVGGVHSTFNILIGLVVGGFGAGAAFFMPRFLLRILRTRRLERFNVQLVEALIGMSNALKAGFSIQQAFETVVQEGQAPLAQEFAMFLQQLRVGVAFDTALKDLDRRIRSEDLTLMIQSIEIARQTGGNLTEVFDRIASTIRERQRVEGKIKSLTAMGRLQGNVVGLMPLVLGFILYFLDPQMMMLFFRSTFGIILLVLILGFEICGAWLIRRIVSIDV